VEATVGKTATRIGGTAALTMGLWMAGPAWATGETGDTGVWYETADTGLADTGTEPGEPDPLPDDTGADDTGSVPEPDFATPSASQLAGELGGFRCDATGALRASPLFGAVLVGLFGLLARRRIA
jgi:hypothetical protein